MKMMMVKGKKFLRNLTVLDLRDDSVVKQDPK
jgi:hypothetical protein